VVRKVEIKWSYVDMYDPMKGRLYTLATMYCDKIEESLRSFFTQKLVIKMKFYRLYCKANDP